MGRVIILYREEAYLAKHVVNEFIERENSCRRSSNSKDKKGQFIFLVNDAFIRMMMSANASLILLFSCLVTTIICTYRDQGPVTLKSVTNRVEICLKIMHTR